MFFNLFTHTFKILIFALFPSLLILMLIMLSYVGWFSWSSLVSVILVIFVLNLLLLVFLILLSFNLSFYLYALALTVLGICIPYLLTSQIIHGFNEPIALAQTFVGSITSKTLFYSYLLIFSYLVPIYGTLVILNSDFLLRRILLPRAKVESVNDKKVRDVCQTYASILGVKMPNLFYIEEPSVYSFGASKDNGNIALFKKCVTLDENKLKAIMIHEISHIKSDIEYHTLQLFFTKNFSFDGIFSLPLLFSTIWLFYDLTISINGTVGAIDRDFLLAINYLPFLLAVSFFSLVAYAKNILYLSIGGRRPVFQMNEFKADLHTYLVLGESQSIIDSLESFRRLQAAYFVENPAISHSLFANVKNFYNKKLGKGFYSKSYRGWLDYFREDYGKLNFTLAKDFDFPRDLIRKDFLEFIDKLCKQRITLRVNKKGKIDLGICWVLKTSLFNGQVALAEWLQEDAYRVPKQRKENIIRYIKSNMSSFNAVECSNTTGASIYEVITIILALLVDGTLSLQ